MFLWGHCSRVAYRGIVSGSEYVQLVQREVGYMYSLLMALELSQQSPAICSEDLHNAVFPSSQEQLPIAAEAATVGLVLEPCIRAPCFLRPGIVDNDLQTALMPLRHQ